ncbi:MAG TPA: NUDIX hydrolase [Candidatus Norongarragalinales archaeon]|jgi:8-oxo-dGTP pyrophosphatase MutT (NUDIX family)|nr:NUDIX hydrolase [Candidatus Norongarragalinales archaeon]
MEKKLGIAAGAIIRNPQGKILFLKRSPKSSWGKLAWQLPGGKIDWGETPEHAAIREVKEETGLTATKLKLAGIFSSKIHSRGSEYFVIGPVYFAKAKGKVNISHEHVDYAWFSLPEALRKAHPYARGIIRRAFKK